MSKNYNKRRDRNPDQIIRVDCGDGFVEVIQPNDDFERVTINLVSLNKDNTQKCMISSYVDVPDFLTLCNRIVAGRFGRLVEDVKKSIAGSNNFPPALWSRQGGKEGPGGAWMFSIHPATKKGDVILTARRGPGELVKDTKLIKLVFGNNNDYVICPLTHWTLEEIANASIMRIQAYIVSRQIRGCYDNLRRTSKGQPETPQNTFVANNVIPINRTDYNSPAQAQQNQFQQNQFQQNQFQQNNSLPQNYYNQDNITDFYNFAGNGTNC